MPTSYFTWNGGYANNNFDDARNWYRGGTGPLPGFGDSLHFVNDPVTNVANPVNNFHAAAGGPYYAITVNFSSTVTLSTAITTGTFNMQMGSTSQDANGQDITVTASFSWTFGNINISSYSGNLNLTKGNPWMWSGTIAPSGGTVTTGSNINILNGAVVMSYAGTVVSTNATTLAVLSGSSFTAEDTIFVSTAANPPTIPVGSGATYTGKGVKEDRGIDVESGGTLIISGQKTSKFLGSAGDPSKSCVRTEQGAIALIIENGSTLETAPTPQEGSGPGGVTINGGKLVTQAINIMGNQPVATIKTSQLAVVGATDIKISDTDYNPMGVTGHKFGRLKVDTTARNFAIDGILWSSGTYRPVVDGTEASNLADVWETTGQFTVWGKANPDDGRKAMLAPVSINNPLGGIVGRSWTVMHADNKISWLSDSLPPSFPPNSGWSLDGDNNVKDWKVKYTG